MSYKHAEAYCLMTYRSDDGTEQEVIWNSRDGVTPFVISLRSGKSATHVNWRSDRCVPDYKPQPGERVFVDLTWERAREFAQEQLSRLTLSAFDSNAPSVIQLAQEYMRHPGAPDLVEAEEYIPAIKEQCPLKEKHEQHEWYKNGSLRRQCPGRSRPLKEGE